MPFLILENCNSPLIGDLYTYNKRKWLLTVCDDLIPRIYDFTLDKTIQLHDIVLYSYPHSLKAYPSINALIITDYAIGDAHIYLFNSTTYSFSFFITLTKARTKDIIIEIELLKDKSLWL